MKKFLLILTIILSGTLLFACKTITTKIDEKTAKEEKELSKWISQPESELKIVFGTPDRVEFLKGRNRYYVYVTEKLKIKCERKFEINEKNIIIGFISTNCF